MRLRNLYEVQIQPGERRGFSLRLKKLEDLQFKVAEMQNTIANLKSTTVPDVIKNKMQELIDTANIEKEKLYSELAVVQKPVPGIEDIPGNVIKLFKGIDKNCSVIMNAYRQTGSFLYRGIKSSEDVLYGKPFDERRAKDSNKKLSDILNNALASQGFDARRDNTSFTSGDEMQAGNYGTVYIFIPRDGFTFHYSKKIRDLVLDPGKLNLLIDNDLAMKLQQAVHAHWEQVKQYFSHRYQGDRLFMDYEYERDLAALQQAVTHGQLPQEFKQYQTLEDLINDQKVIQQFEYNQTDLEAAITSKHEVMVRGAYYAISKSGYEKYFRRYLELTKNGPIDITPDSRKEKKSLNDKVSSALGQEPEEFENGDIVKHNYEPIFGEVVNNFYTNEFLQVKNYNKELILVKKTNVKKIDVGTIEKFEPGDKVIFNTKGSDFSHMNKKRGVVVKAEGIGLTVKYGTYGDTVEIPVFLVNRAAKYDTENPETGDTVKITQGEFKGAYGKITYVSSYKDIDVDMGDGSSESVSNGYYEVVDPATVPAGSMDAKFPEGAFVQINADGEKMAGYVGTIKKSGPIVSTVRIFGGTHVHPTQKINNSRLVEINEDEYELRKLDHGAQVIVVKGKHRGKTGRITYFYSNGSIEVTPSNGGQYFEVEAKDVVIKDKYTGNLDPNYKATGTGDNTPEYKIGDKVVAKTGWAAGKTVEVIDVYSNGSLAIKTDTGNSLDISAKDVEPAKEPDDDLIDLVDLDFEPLDEPTAPKSSNSNKPKVGDTVKIIKGKDVGNIGKVGYVYSSGESVEIEFADGSSDTYSIANIEISNKPTTKKSFDADALPFMVGDDANATNPKVVNKKWEIAEIHPDHVVLKNKTTQGTLKLAMDKFYKANPEYDAKNFKPGDKVLFTSGNFKDFEGVVVGNETPTSNNTASNSGDIKVKISMYGKDSVIPTSISNIKKIGVSDEIIFPSSVKTSAEAESIVKKAKESGTITYNEIDKIFDGDTTGQGVEDIFKMFDSLGINVIPDPEMFDPNETPAEKKQRIIEPNNKAELLELLKNKEVKPLMRKAINDKSLSYVDQLNLAMAADEKYYTLLLPYLELKGVNIVKYDDSK